VLLKSRGTPLSGSIVVFFIIDWLSIQVLLMSVYVSVNWYPKKRKVESLDGVKQHIRFLKTVERFMKNMKIFMTAYRAVLATYVTTEVEPNFVLNKTRSKMSTPLESIKTRNSLNFVIKFSKSLHYMNTRSFF
jgi:hypothetical protein